MRGILGPTSLDGKKGRKTCRQAFGLREEKEREKLYELFSAVSSFHFTSRHLLTRPADSIRTALPEIRYRAGSNFRADSFISAYSVDRDNRALIIDFERYSNIIKQFPVLPFHRLFSPPIHSVRTYLQGCYTS